MKKGGIVIFCHKCGNKSIEGSAFCQKCGAKLIVDDISQQMDAIVPAKSIQSQTLEDMADKPKKKKSKKFVIILGVIMGLFLIGVIIASNADTLQEAGEQARTDEEYIASQQQAPDAEASQTLTSTDAVEPSVVQGSTTPEEIITYNIFGYDFASGVPDFLAFVTNGAKITNEGNATIGTGSAVAVDIGYGYEWSEDERNTYHDLLRDRGFTLNQSSDGYYGWTSDEIGIDMYFVDPESVGVCIIDRLFDDGIDEDYYDEYNFVIAAPIDESLVGGRWAADDGGRLEFFSDGTGNTNLDLWPLEFGWSGDTKNITWQATDGRLTLVAHLTRQREYITNGEKLYLENYGNYRRTEGSAGDGLVGTWMPIGSGGGGIELREDGTGEDQIARLGDCTWAADDTILTLQYDHGRWSDYTVQGDQLTIYRSNGISVFTRIGGN